jgi:hypoxanthine phosphoribosyltransferase
MMQQPVRVHDKLFEVYLTETQILDKVAELGEQIVREFSDAPKPPLLVPILNGSFIFAADLARACSIPLEVSFVKLSSYQGLSSTGKVNKAFGLGKEVEGRDVILVEDIIDSGKTLSAFIPQLEELRPRSVTTAALLVKPEALEHQVPISFKGFDIPNKFVIGYGLDYDEQGRNLRHIYQLKEEASENG